MSLADEIKADLEELITRVESDFPLYQISPLVKKIWARVEQDFETVVEDVKDEVKKVASKVKNTVKEVLDDIEGKNEEPTPTPTSDGKDPLSDGTATPQA